MQKETKSSNNKTIALIFAILFCCIIICYFSIVVASAIDVLVKHVSNAYEDSFVWQENLNYYVNQLLKTLVIFCAVLPIMGLIIQIVRKKLNKVSLIVSITVSAASLIYVFFIDKLFWKTNIILTCVIIIATFVDMYFDTLFKPKTQKD